MLTATVDTSEFDAAAREFERDLAGRTRTAVSNATQDAIEHVRRSHRYQDKTGKLTRSLRVGQVRVPPGGGGAEVELRADAAHASFVEEDTRAHDIRPKAAKAFVGPLHESQTRRRDKKPAKARLVFKINGQWVSKEVVKHPGTHGKAFMGEAVQIAERKIVAGVELAAVEAGKVFDR